MMAQGDVFSLVQQFDKMRQGLGTGGGGVGRPMEKPQPVGQAYGQQQVQPAVAGRPASGLVDFRGHKFDASVMPSIEQLVSKFGGLRVSGGHRTPERNVAVNGVKNSRHLAGKGADFVADAKTMQQAAAWAKQQGIPEVLIHNAGSGQHLHLGWD